MKIYESPKNETDIKLKLARSSKYRETKLLMSIACLLTHATLLWKRRLTVDVNWFFHRGDREVHK